MYRYATAADAAELKKSYDYCVQLTADLNIITMPSLTQAEIEALAEAGRIIMGTRAQNEYYTDCVCFDASDPEFVRIDWSICEGDPTTEAIKAYIVLDHKLPIRYYAKHGGPMAQRLAEAPLYISENTRVVGELTAGDEVWDEYEFVSPQLGLFEND